MPATQAQKGRATKGAAAAYLAKTYLYKAYRQSENNSVTGINSQDLQEVLTYTSAVLGSTYALEEDFAFNFLPGGYEMVKSRSLLCNTQ